MRKSFSIHSDYFEEIKRCSNEQRGGLLLALVSWATDTELPPLDPETAMLFRLMKAAIERISIVNAANGKSGGAPQGNANAQKTTETSETKKNNRNKPTVSVTVTDTVTVSDSVSNITGDMGRSPDGEATNTKKRFEKPMYDEVSAYCRERGNGIDAQRFLDHYDANGWRVGKNPMKDWRAALRTWERSEGGKNAGYQECDKPGRDADRRPRYGTVL